ncbi:MAG: carboxypeptidase-like regulatory domain-containing protein [Armatimonadota bacterium]
MHRKARLGWLTGLMAAVAIIAVGCGGGDGEGGEAPPPPATATGTLNGQVVDASDTNTVVPNAEVTVEAVGETTTAQAGARTVTTGADGGFSFDDLPAGDWIVSAVTPRSEELGGGRARAPVTDDATTTVSLAVLPLGLAAPERIELSPTSTTIDVGGRVDYRAQIIGPGGEVYEEIKPTWVVAGRVGEITPDGVFTADRAGSGSVRAYSGDAQRASSVEVVAPRPPQISSFRVNPQSLGASGGEVLISAAVSDGDGVDPQDVVARILPPGGEPIDVQLSVTNPDSAIRCPGVPNCFVSASFGATYEVPANDNRPTADGVQAPQTYAVSIHARDGRDVSAESEFVEFVVQGIESPPTRPGI